MVAGLVAGVLGGLGSMGSGFFSGATAAAQNRQQYEYARALQAQQFEYNKWFGRNRHQQEVLDLKDAGLNPLLSATTGTGTGSVGIPSVNQVDEASAQNTGQQVRNQTVLTKSQVNLQNAQSAQQVASAYNQRMQGQLTLAQANNLNSGAALAQAQRQLTLLQQTAQQITNSNLNNYQKAQIKNLLQTGQASIAGAIAQQASASAAQMNAITNAQWAGYNAISQRISAKASRLNARVNAKVAPFNAVSQRIGVNNNPYTLGYNIGSSVGTQLRKIFGMP